MFKSTFSGERYRLNVSECRGGMVIAVELLHIVTVFIYSLYVSVGDWTP